MHEQTKVTKVMYIRWDILMHEQTTAMDRTE